MQGVCVGRGGGDHEHWRLRVGNEQEVTRDGVADALSDRPILKPWQPTTHDPGIAA